MIYNGTNAAGALVMDVDAKQRIDRVLMVNTKTGAVVVGTNPYRPNHKGSIERETIYFDSVYPIFGGRAAPVLFHCYGRKRSMTEVVAAVVAFMQGIECKADGSMSPSLHGDGTGQALPAIA